MFISKTPNLLYLGDAEYNGLTKPGPAHYGEDGRIDHIMDASTRKSTAVHVSTFTKKTHSVYSIQGKPRPPSAPSRRPKNKIDNADFYDHVTAGH